MSNLLIVIIDLWVLCGIILTLHFYKSRIGIAPLILVVTTSTVFLQSQVSIFIEPFPDLILFINSNVFVPIILVAVLVLYVSNGSVSSRAMIYGVVGVSVLTVVIPIVYRIHLTLPDSGSFTNLTKDELVRPVNLRTTAASIGAFIIDMFVIAIFYQGIRNYSQKIPEWVSIGLSLLASLWADSILFQIFSNLGSDNFLDRLPGDIIGKAISTTILWPMVAFYLIRLAPRLSDHVGVDNRPTFDLIFGSLEEIKLVLLKTQTALKESEAERHKQAEYFQQISDHIHEAIWLAEPYQNHAFYVNPAYEKLWGRSATSLYADSSSFVDALHPEDKDRILSGLHRQVHGNYDVEYRVIRPDGDYIWVRDRAFPITDEKGHVYRIAGISEDITERKEMEKQRLELAVAKERVKLLRAFISEVSHDLKTPLASLRLKVYLLRDIEDVEEREKYYDQFTQVFDRIGSMIDNLLTLSRLESIHDTAMTEVSINKIVHEVVDLTSPLAQSKNQKISTNLVTLDTSILGDYADLSRVIDNLITNAIHYTLPGGKIDIETRMSNQEVIIEVKDNGIGIPEKDQPYVFDRLFRSSNANEADAGGTGLGLAIVQKIITQHNGRINVESEVGNGTTFTMYLPINNAVAP